MSRHALVIDDNDEHRSWLANALRARGYNVTIARSGRLALELAARQQPDVVVSELVLPDVRGLDLPRSLRAVVQRPVRVIAVTRLPPELHESAKRAGFDHVHCKPLDVEALDAHLR